MHGWWCDSLASSKTLPICFAVATIWLGETPVICIFPQMLMTSSASLEILYYNLIMILWRCHMHLQNTFATIITGREKERGAAACIRTHPQGPWCNHHWGRGNREDQTSESHEGSSSYDRVSVSRYINYCPMETLSLIIKVILSSYLHMYQWMVVCHITSVIRFYQYWL